MIIFLIFIYFFLILVLSAVKPFHFSGKMIYLFRAFFPSWKFFEDIGEIPVLYYRVSDKEENDLDWQPCLLKSKRRISSLILNPSGNYLLACESLLQQFVNDVQDLEEEALTKIEDSISYKLIQNLVCFQVREHSKNHSHLFYQFKVSIISQELHRQSDEDLLISPIYQVRNEV
jgi:hypothetical protein